MPNAISTNLLALNARRNLEKNSGGQTAALQRLSSGKRINSAKDDAAGLAVSERMTSQIRGQEVAQRNTNDAISLAQTAEGALQEMDNILQRCRELCVQAANGTNTPRDRVALGEEVNQLLTQFERIGSSTEFNGKKLFDGSFSSEAFQVGSNEGESINLSLPSIRKDQSGYYRLDSSYGASIFGNPVIAGNDSSWLMSGSGYNSFASTYMPARSMGMAGHTIPIAMGEDAGSVAAKINALTPETGVTARGATSVAISFLPSGTNRSLSLRLVAGEDYTQAASVSFNFDGSESTTQAAMAAINAVSAKTGVIAEEYYSVGTDCVIRLTNTDGKTLHVLNDSAPGVFTGFHGADWTESRGFMSNDFTTPQPGTSGTGVFGVDDTFCFGAISLESSSPVLLNPPDGYYDGFGDTYGYFHGSGSSIVSLDDISFETGRAASNSIKVFDGALQQINGTRAKLGAMQSRFDANNQNLSVSTENLTASRSRIVDTDFASETAELTRQQILQQAGTAMLAQANLLPQQVLSLLKD